MVKPMKTKEQKIETYSNIHYAKQNMKRNIEDGWFIHTCVSTCESDGIYGGILVVYEKDLQTWN